MSKFSNYQHIQNFFIRVRDPDKGRKVNACCRVFATPNGAYEFKFYNRPIFQVTPDNVLTFICSNEDAYPAAVSISATLHRIVPLVWLRKRYKFYQVSSYSFIPRGERDWAELFKGLQFDLNSKKFLNAKAPLLERVDKDKKLEWTRLITKFKRGLRVRVKLGAVQAVIDNIIATQDTGKSFMKPDWTSNEWQEFLLDCIVKDEYPMALLVGIARTHIRLSYWGGIKFVSNPESLMSDIDNMMNECSIGLRTKFGVFVD